MPAQDPITHPIYGSAPISTAPTSGMYGNPGIPTQTPIYGQPQAQTAFPTFQPPSMQPTAELYNPTAFNTQAVAPSAYPPSTNMLQNHQQNVIGHVEKPQPIQKPPIPEEHVHMQTVFDELRIRCSNSAGNPVRIRNRMILKNIYI